MKKISLILAALTLTFMFSCKNANKKEAKQKEKTTQTTTGKQLKVDTSSVQVKWTAYKTTDKVAVKGEFNKVTLANLGTGSTWKAILNGATFKIDANKLSTGNEARDKKIRESFFGEMMQPGKISGEFVQAADSTWAVKVTMNGVDVKLPAEVSYANNTLQLKATVDLNEFEALEALQALNKVCGKLHTGKDGVSKTWEVVDVKASVGFTPATQK